MKLILGYLFGSLAGLIALLVLATGYQGLWLVLGLLLVIPGIVLAASDL